MVRTSAAAPARRERRSLGANRWLLGSIGLVVFLLAFEALGRAGIVDRSYLPPSSTVIVHAVRLAGDTGFLGDVGVTLASWSIGLVITVVVGVPLGVLLGSVPGVNAAAGAIVEFLRPIPSVALIPLASLLLGPDLNMRASLIVYASIWPVLFNTIYGLADTDATAKETLRTFGFGPLSVLWRVSLPSAAPFIATGVRLAASIAIIVAVGTEIQLGRGSGIGAYISQASSGGGNTTAVLAATAWAGMIGLLINSLLVAGERRAFRWHHLSTGRTA